MWHTKTGKPNFPRKIDLTVSKYPDSNLQSLMAYIDQFYPRPETPQLDREDAAQLSKEELIARLTDPKNNKLIAQLKKKDKKEK